MFHTDGSSTPIDVQSLLGSTCYWSVDMPRERLEQLGQDAAYYSGLLHRPITLHELATVMGRIDELYTVVRVMEQPGFGAVLLPEQSIALFKHRVKGLYKHWQALWFTCVERLVFPDTGGEIADAAQKLTPAVLLIPGIDPLVSGAERRMAGFLQEYAYKNLDSGVYERPKVTILQNSDGSWPFGVELHQAMIELLTQIALLSKGADTEL